MINLTERNLDLVRIPSSQKQTNRQEKAPGKYINIVSQKQMSDENSYTDVVTRNHSAQIAEQENSVNANNHGGNTTRVEKNEGESTPPNSNPQVPANKAKNRAIVKGKAASEEEEFQAAKRMVWIFVGRAGPSSSAGMLQNHLKSKLNFNVAKIKKHESNTNPNKS
ncbi:hypothetical protein HHI36_006600 [Cryptolaemus montrouzieri]|uniref:Uncharacterized protein n=1 Tax=Cryptolaemus montrouzieri TaxID=559131 RepID=A0ABD2NXJ9_9CUCU